MKSLKIISGLFIIFFVTNSLFKYLNPYLEQNDHSDPDPGRKINEDSNYQIYIFIPFFLLFLKNAFYSWRGVRLGAKLYHKYCSQYSQSALQSWLQQVPGHLSEMIIACTVSILFIL